MLFSEKHHHVVGMTRDGTIVGVASTTSDDCATPSRASEMDPTTNKAGPKGRGKHWCFTINNYDEEEQVPAPEDVEYIVMGKEVGEDGTPHI